MATKSSFEAVPLPGGDRGGFHPWRAPLAADFSPDAEEALPEPDSAEDIRATEHQALKGSVATAIGALAGAVDEMREASARERAQWESDAIDLAFAIAQRLVERELELDRQTLVPLVERAFTLVDSSEELVLTLSPGDRDALESGSSDRLAALVETSGVTVRTDDTLARGEAHLQAGASSLELRTTTLLRSIRQELDAAFAETAS